LQLTPTYSNMKQIEIDGIGPVLFEHSKRARRMIITITPRTGVRVAVPDRAAFKRAEEFVHSKAKWIKKQLALMEQVEREFDGKAKEINRSKARQKLIKRLEELASKNGFPYNRISIRNQKTRWGSCSSKNNISLNIKLVLLPEELMDYVILHELVHTQIKNHSKDFWDELDKYTADAKIKASELRRYGLALL